MISGPHRHLSADLVIQEQNFGVIIAAEFKDEPSHQRHDIQKQKLPVVFWGMGGVQKDIQRVFDFVRLGRAQFAYSIFIDEGGYFIKRPPHEQSLWKDWGNGVWVLEARAAKEQI